MSNPNYYLNFPCLLFVALFVSCASTPVTRESIEQQVQRVIPVPLAPPALEVAILAEPLGVRWPLVRVEVTTQQTGPDGRAREVQSPAKDTVLGVGLGSGLFLDSAGNLNLLPRALAGLDDVEAFEFLSIPSAVVWRPSSQRPVSIVDGKYESTVSFREMFGTTTIQIDKGLPQLVALGKKVAKGEGSRIYEVEQSLIEFLLIPTVYEPVEGGVKKSVFGLPPVEVTYTTDGEVLRASDGSLRINRLADHLEILYRNDHWLYYRAEDSGLVINVKTGQTFRWAKTADGLVADGGLYIRTPATK